MSTELKLRVTDESIARLEDIASQCGLMSVNGGGTFTRAFKLAAGIRALRSAITDEMMDDVMQLQGSSLGFKTDKDKDRNKDGSFGYGREEVKECAIECILRGGMLVGNEMNIIAGRFYATKEFFTRVLREFPGLTDLVLTPGVPVLVPGGTTALVPYTSTWKLNGKSDILEKTTRKLEDGSTEDTRISVRVNGGMGPDAVLGKAERKMRAAIYNRITCSNISDADVDDRSIVVTASPALPAGQSKSSGIAAELASRTSNFAPKTTSTAPPHPLAELPSMLAECSTDEHVQAIYNSFEHGLNDDDRLKLAVACDKRRAELLKPGAAKK